MSSRMESLKQDMVSALTTSNPRRLRAILKSPEADVAWLDRPIDSGGCALHLGALYNQVDAVHALLEFGCDPNVVNQDGETPLHVAAEKQFYPIVDMLLDAVGVRVDAARRRDKRTALHLAAAHGCVEAVRRLIGAGASIDGVDRDGNTAVFLAVQSNRHQVVHELVAHGANLKLRNSSQQTCLSYAMKQSQDKSLIRLLVDRKSIGAAAQPAAAHPPGELTERRATQLSRAQSLARQTPAAGQAQRGGGLPAEEAADTSRHLRHVHPFVRVTRQPGAEAAIPEERQLQTRRSSARRKELKSAGVQVGPGANPSDSEDDEASSCYSMDSRIRGLCIIINNQDYFNSDDFKERAGTDLDERRLERLFKSLRFHVKIFKNLDAKDIYWNLSNYAKSDHTSYDCYVCCILAHGTLGGIYGVDGKVQKLADLTVMLSSTNCPSLAGKPKLFFIQACRGRCLQRGAHFDRHQTRDMIQMANHETDAASADEQQEYILPDHGDFLIGYATVAQHIAQRHREQGSVYVQTLCDVIERERHREDLLSMLTKVKYRVSKHVFTNEDGSVFVQMPEVKETLRKKIYFT